MIKIIKLEIILIQINQKSIINILIYCFILYTLLHNLKKNVKLINLTTKLDILNCHN